MSRRRRIRAKKGQARETRRVGVCVEGGEGGEGRRERRGERERETRETRIKQKKKKGKKKGPNMHRRPGQAGREPGM